jgi:hypothetical protein
MPLPVGYVEWGKRTRIIRIWYHWRDKPNRNHSAPQGPATITVAALGVTAQPTLRDGKQLIRNSFSGFLPNSPSKITARKS